MSVGLVHEGGDLSAKRYVLTWWADQASTVRRHCRHRAWAKAIATKAGDRSAPTLIAGNKDIRSRLKRTRYR